MAFCLNNPGVDRGLHEPRARNEAGGDIRDRWPKEESWYDVCMQLSAEPRPAGSSEPRLSGASITSKQPKRTTSF